MSIVITNISRRCAKRCRYLVRINAMVVTEFKHDRADGLAACLRRAADAVDKHEADKVLRILEALSNPSF